MKWNGLEVWKNKKIEWNGIIKIDGANGGYV